MVHIFIFWQEFKCFKTLFLFVLTKTKNWFQYSFYMKQNSPFSWIICWNWIFIYWTEFIPNNLVELNIKGQGSGVPEHFWKVFACWKIWQTNLHFHQMWFFMYFPPFPILMGMMPWLLYNCKSNLDMFCHIIAKLPIFKTER